jgi:hypothetical protein
MNFQLISCYKNQARKPHLTPRDFVSGFAEKRMPIGNFPQKRPASSGPREFDVKRQTKSCTAW